MFENLDLFRLSADMASHAGRRQAVSARNIANSDTPGFRAERLASFADSYRGQAEGLAVTRTRPMHLSGAPASAAMIRSTPALTEPSPNGNSVSLEEEMLQAADIQREHQRALAIYRHGLTVLRSVLAR